MPESSRFRTPLESQRGHGIESLLKSARHDFHPNFPLSQEQLSWERSHLVICEILGLFGNTLTTAHIYSRHNSEKFQRHVETPFSQKP